MWQVSADVGIYPSVHYSATRHVSTLVLTSFQDVSNFGKETAPRLATPGVTFSVRMRLRFSTLGVWILILTLDF